ncbi:hypothetical protein BGZ60DRAFT_423447 [Tricladium varicosporioides]|nr:hypothetical protein BGZ60DRAFT_423447 [Hymenoscyphus varicosporioides]
MDTSNTDQQTSPSTHWRFAFQKRSETSYLHLLELSPHDSGPMALRKLRAEHERIARSTSCSMCGSSGIFWDPVIEVALLSENSTTDLEAQKGPCVVLVSDRRRDHELTAAFRDPSVLSGAESFVQRNERFAARSLASGFQDGRQVIFIRNELTWLGIWTIVLVGTIFCISVGAVVGVLTKRVDLGVGVTSSLATLVTCVEAFAFWLYK